MSTSRRMKPYGWGWDDVDSLQLSQSTVNTVKGFFGDNLTANSPPRIEDIKLNPPRFDLTYITPNPAQSSLLSLSSPVLLSPTTTNSTIEDICDSSKYERIRHSYGKSFRDTVRSLRGNFENSPDYVAFPRNEDDVFRLFKFAEYKRVGLIPWGGGTSVVGGVEPPSIPQISPRDNVQFNGYISVDMCNFNKVKNVDMTSLTADVEAGVFGPALNSQLKNFGLTFRHFPQSWEFSTVGGWVATHSGGHHSTVETHIGDFVQSIRILTPSGLVQTNKLPFSGAGPYSNGLFVGSEGILGIITEVCLRVQKLILYNASATVRFPTFFSGVEAVRHISQSRLLPNVCRIFDELESKITGLSPKGQATLLLGFESSLPDSLSIVKQSLQQALQLCKIHGNAEWKETDVTIRETSSDHSIPVNEDKEMWRRTFLEMPYIRDGLASYGLILETFETCCTWAAFRNLHEKVFDCVFNTLSSLNAKGIVTCRFTHIYPDGPAPYFTVIAMGDRKKQLEDWDTIKSAVSKLLVSNGGTITHHHAVGRDHAPFLEQERNPMILSAYHSLKNFFDPNHFMNPGVLISLKSKSKL